MKKQLLLGLIAFSLILSSSCKKKSQEEEEQPDPFKLEYSNLSTEEQKQEIEKAGIDFIAKIDDLPEQKFIDVLAFLSSLNPELSDQSTLLERILTMGTNAKEENLNGIFKNTASVSSASLISNRYGIYTWNSSIHNWDKTLSGNRLEIRFPSSDDKVANNATLTFTYLPSSIKSDLGDGYELPAYLSVVLKVDNVEELRLTSSYSYKDDGTPSKSDMILNLGIYAFRNVLRNDGILASSEWTISKKTEVLISSKIESDGNTTLDNIGADEDIVKNANASLEIMNIKLLGEADIKGLRADTSYKSESDSSLRNAKKAEIFNSHTRFIAINSTGNLIMGRNEFFPVSENGKNTVQARLVFKDDSKMNFEAFFKEGFQGFMDSMDEFVQKF